MTHPLSGLSIASPCNADWEKMQGTEQVRFCDSCKLNVYNLSEMSREAAETLILGTEGRLCVRFFQRQDGTVITRDCPVGLKALHRKKLSRFGKVAAVATVITVVGSFCISNAENTQNQKPDMNKMMVMGEMAVPEPNAMMGAVAQPKQTEPEPTIKPPTENEPSKAPHQSTMPDNSQPQANPQALLGRIALPITPETPDSVKK